MLTIHEVRNASQSWNQGDPLPETIAWLDLVRPEDDEITLCEALVDERLPRRQDLAGFGLSGQNRNRRDTIFLHIARFMEPDEADAAACGTPILIVLSRNMLLTSRQIASPTFELALARWRSRHGMHDASSAFAALVELIAERTASGMLEVAESVATLSAQVFSSQRNTPRALRAWLLDVGMLETRLARSRGSLLGITRVVTFVRQRNPQWFDDAMNLRIDVVWHDLFALDQFEGQLTDKLQFLLDAILGLISVNQNSVMKVFTVISAVAVPPVLLAGIWGMNFHGMPLLDEPWGYALALGAIVASALIPLAIFKWIGWLSAD